MNWGQEIKQWFQLIKSAMRVIVGLESDEQNGYAFQASFGELNESKKLDGFFNFILE